MSVATSTPEACARSCCAIRMTICEEYSPLVSSPYSLVTHRPPWRRTSPTRDPRSVG